MNVKENRLVARKRIKFGDIINDMKVLIQRSDLENINK
jgi:hypothetical protein